MSHPSPQSTAALPAGTIALLTGLWLAGGLPLTIAGAVVGRRVGAARGFEAPTRATKFPREASRGEELGGGWWGRGREAGRPPSVRPS